MKVKNIQVARTAMIVVGMQHNFAAPNAPMKMPAARAIMRRLAQALTVCRYSGIRVIFTANLQRQSSGVASNHDDIYPLAADYDVLVESIAQEIYPDLAPAQGELVIKKRRYSAFFGTDLDSVLRESNIDTVIIAGTTTENCCLATARDAMFRNYQVVVLADATATFDHPDRGFGAMSAAEMHRATLVVLAASTAHVMSVTAMSVRITADHRSFDTLTPALTSPTPREGFATWGSAPDCAP